MIRDFFKETNIFEKQVEKDADASTIFTAVNYCLSYEKVAVVGEDIDLLVLLSQFGEEYENLYFIKQNKGSVNNIIYSTNSFKYAELSSFVAFLHAFSGADIKSAFFKVGKGKFLKTLLKNRELQNTLKCFHEADETPALTLKTPEYNLLQLFMAEIKMTLLIVYATKYLTY